MDFKLETVIAERELLCGKGQKRLVVRVGAPKKAEEIDWVCPYQIVGLEGSKVSGAYGVDAIQALIMALEAIRVRLARARLVCKWVGGQDGDSGFPRIVPAYFGAAFASRVDRLIDRELDDFGEKLRSKVERKRKAK